MHATTPRLLLVLALLLAGACAPPPEAPEGRAPPAPSTDITTLTAIELRERLAAGELTAAAVTAAFLSRIAALDDDGPRLNAIVEVNPEAEAIAARLDEAFATRGVVGPLHGLPVVLKANIDTADAMATSAGSLALADHRARADAFLVARLRGAGAVVLGKANLSEWANFRDENSSSGWSSIGGQTRNPFVLDRNPCGSSSGSAVAVAAALAPLAVGTETNGSIVCPAGINGVVGIKPTLGLVSRDGIIPIAASQDTAGPMARDVRSAALLLETLAAFDPRDPGAVEAPSRSYLPDHGATRLDGIRIGVLRTYLGAGRYPEVAAIYERAVATLAELGAELVDPIEYRASEDLQRAEYDLLLYEFKAGLETYLAGHGVAPDLDTLDELIAFNERERARVMPIFGQSIFLDAAKMGGIDTDAYRETLAASQGRLRADVDALFAEHALDALLVPVNGPAWKTDWVSGDRYTFGGTASLAAITGYPSVVLPAGTTSGLPIAVGFTGRAFSERALIQMAYALEQALALALEPGFVPTLEHD